MVYLLHCKASCNTLKREIGVEEDNPCSQRSYKRQRTSAGGRSNPGHGDSEKSTKWKVLHEVLANFLCQLMSSKVYYPHTQKYIYNKTKIIIIVVIIYRVYYLQGTILNALYALLHLTLTTT